MRRDPDSPIGRFLPDLTTYPKFNTLILDFRVGDYLLFSMGISFRPFDAGKDSEILARFLIDTKSLDGTTPEDPAKDCEAYIASVISTQQRDPAFAAIMMDGEERIGFVHVYPVIQKPEIAFLPFDYLTKERRGRGLGKHLMDYAANTARARGCTKLVLDVSKTNASAISFYRRHGFETVKEHGLLFRMRRDI